MITINSVQSITYKVVSVQAQLKPQNLGTGNAETSATAGVRDDFVEIPELILARIRLTRSKSNSMHCMRTGEVANSDCISVNDDDQIYVNRYAGGNALPKVTFTLVYEFRSGYETGNTERGKNKAVPLSCLRIDVLGRGGEYVLGRPIQREQQTLSVSGTVRCECAGGAGPGRARQADTVVYL
ncbi:hypothetical protein EVAR_69780_1 [Eumeta japonica]|uniref:Uncharacterized protein n=1 Tax=Eumeta variegata TaxID=151549 RepID=A0A4C2A1T7_EUMVA|nr:hypothetical protein EVAR_69780_1 [Eumeta japonica]